MVAYTLEGSVLAMHLKSQLFGVPVSYTERWCTGHERINPTATIAEGSTTEDLNFYIPPSSSGLISLNDICLELDLGLQVKTPTSDWRMITMNDGVVLANKPTLFHLF